MNATKTTTAVIRDFLALPAESLPAATAIEGGGKNVWGNLRAYLAGQREIAKYGYVVDHPYFNGIVRLSADRDEWRDGVIVTLEGGI